MDRVFYLNSINCSVTVGVTQLEPEVLMSIIPSYWIHHRGIDIVLNDGYFIE